MLATGALFRQSGVRCRNLSSPLARKFMVLRVRDIRYAGWRVAVLFAAAVFGWAALPAGAYDRYSVYDGCRAGAYWDGACRGYVGICGYPDDCHLEPLYPPRHRWRSQGWERPRHARPPAERRARRTPPAPESRSAREDDERARAPAETEPDRRGEDADEEQSQSADTMESPRREAAENGKIPQRYRDMRNTVGHTLAAITRGAEHYQRHCTACHGDTGAGDGPRAQRSDPRMPDLNFTVEQDYATDAYLIWTILEGGKPLGADKPAFADTLSQRQAWQVIAYMRAEFPQPDARRTAQGMMPSGNGEDEDSENR